MREICPDIRLRSRECNKDVHVESRCIYSVEIFYRKSNLCIDLYDYYFPPFDSSPVIPILSIMERTAHSIIKLEHICQYKKPIYLRLLEQTDIQKRVTFAHYPSVRPSIGEDLVFGFGEDKRLNFGGERWRKFAFKPIHVYFTLVPIKCFQCLKK